MSGSVDRKVRPPWHPRKGDKVHIWGIGWVSERTAFILVLIVVAAAAVIAIANVG